MSSSNGLSRDAWNYRGEDINQRLIERNNVPKALDALRSHAERPAVTWYKNGVRSVHLNYGDLLLHVASTADHLERRLGIQRGDRVVVMTANCPEAFVVHLAIMSIGAVTVPMNPVESTRIIEFVFGQVEPRLVLVGEDAECPKMKFIKYELLSSICNVAQNPSFAGEAEQAEPRCDIEPDALAVILFTSGTTSQPKGVCLSHYNLLINAEGLRGAHGLGSNNVHMCVLPLFHANAFGFSLVASIYSGNHVILCNGLPPFRAVSIMRDEHVNIMSAVPQIIQVLAEKPEGFADLPHLKYLVSAAAPLRKDVARRFYRNTGIPVRQGYGLSECVNFAATIRGDVPRSTYEKLMFDWQVPSIGTALFGCELRIQTLDGVWAEPKEEGEIVISGHNVMLGYWRSAEATIATVGDGFLRTGDLGFFAIVDGEENFFITGRRKEIIIRHGLNVSPLSIERELLDLEKIGDFAVAGFVNEAAGEEIGLYIVGNHTKENEERVLAILGRCVAQYRPGVVVFGKEPIPATPTGKIKRQLLTERFYQFKGRVLGQHPIISTYVEEMAGH